MKIHSIVFLHIIFLCLLTGHHSSNPDSVITQDSEGNDQKIDDMQIEESQERAVISRAGRRYFIIAYMRPFIVGSRVVWKEVRRETVDLRQFRNAWRNFRIGMFDSRRTTEKSIINVNNGPNVDDNNSQIPPNRDEENDNDYDENSKTINSFSGATESEEEYFEVENPENEATKSPEKISPDSNFFAGIVNNFAFTLVEKINLESNFVISPLSIFVALSMCYLGADGRTKAQLEQALGMNENAIHGEHLHQGIKALLSLVLKDSHSYNLFLANGMFLGQNFTADAQFEKNMKKYYDAELENVDFGNPELSERLINDWVVRNTNNTIRRIIDSPPSLSTRLILLNAVYFEGYWKIRFPLHLTYPGNFHAIDGSETRVSCKLLTYLRR